MKATLLRLALLAGLLLFLFFGDVPERSRFWSAFFDAGHTALFGVIALLVRGFIARPRAGRRPPAGWAHTSLLAFAWTVILGAATEVLQSLQRRGDPSIADLLRDTAGAAAFLLIADAVRWGLASRRLPDGREEHSRPLTRSRLFAIAGALLAAVLLLLAAGRTLIVTTAAYVARDRALPTLFPMDGSWWEREFIELQGSRLTPGVVPPVMGTSEVRGTFARLELRPGSYSGITFDEPYPDWRGHRSLVLTIVSDLDVPLPMAVRVHDAAHDHRYADRFNRRLLVQPGVNRFVIPIDDIRKAPDRREMDLRRVRGIILFAYRLTRRTHVYLGPVFLQ